MNNLDTETKRNVQKWLEGDYDSDTKEEIKRTLEKDPQAVTDAFYTTLAFGTGGLRGVMGFGTNRINRYTICQATQGLANHLLKKEGPYSVVIGYDCRHHSRFFAEESAKVLAANGIRAYLFEELRPTPLVSFACRYMGCSGAIMITASHNPPAYNGYKVYGRDGGQVVPPDDAAIIEEVNKVSDLSQVKKLETVDSPDISFIGSEIDEAYLKAVSSLQHYPTINQEHGKELKVIYSSLHGTGITLVPQTLKSWGIENISFVDQQAEPDGSFPTVKFPNPEEREALQLGIDQMVRENGDLLIATDPDADRVGVAVMHAGEARLLSGNQIACICLEHTLKSMKLNKDLPENGAVVKTIGTTEMFQAIADTYQVPVFNVLTGFKYIAELIQKWEQSPKGYRFIFGGEESYGYLLGTHSRDKDAVLSSALICEAALQAKREGKTLIDYLDALYRRYGVYAEKLFSFQFPETKKGKEKMDAAMQKLRKTPPREIHGLGVDVIEDYFTSEKITLESGQKERLVLHRSNVLLFWLEDGSKLMVRPSGTEPKVKIYAGVSVREFDNLEAGKQEAERKLDNILDEIKQLLGN